MASGTIVKLKLDRGFGFIAEDGRRTGRDLFFHCSALRGGLEFDETLLQRRVTFNVAGTEYKPSAENIRAEG